ncbi:hypothetical protein LCGC14_1335090 [marine sediment metagenome]|uniref:Uncharacterized protein n=1 Tax=marine sediment metagenome TaxID=412755 RepID=A0A0F9L1H3_9ZZZZ
MKRKKNKGIVFLLLCLLLVFSQKPVFSATLRKSSSLSSLPSKFVSFTYHAVDTVNGNVYYINTAYQNLLGPNLYLTKQLVFGRAESYGHSKDSIIGLGIGFRRYIGWSSLAGLWCGGSVSIVNVFNLEALGWPGSVTGPSGLLMGNIGYTWFFKERLAMEILLGLTWPSLYMKPGAPDDLYASSFFGLGLSFAL